MKAVSVQIVLVFKGDGFEGVTESPESIQECINAYLRYGAETMPDGFVEARGLKVMSIFTLPDEENE